MIHDAVVVGAGLSGLVCARRLRAAGARAIVVEAQGRVGGRLVSGEVGGAVVDLGGHWMSVDQPRLLALAGELGVRSQPQPRAGRGVLDEAGGHGLFAQLAAAIAQWRSMRRIERMMRAIPGAAPAEASGAAALDAIAVGPWLAGAIGNALARERIAMHAELVFAADPAGLSLLAYLARLGATGGFAPRGPDLPGGGRDHRFVGGAQQLALALADELGDAVRLANPVLAVERKTRSDDRARQSRDDRESRDAPESLGARDDRDRDREGRDGRDHRDGHDIAGPLVVRGPAGSLHARHVVLALSPPLAIRIAPGLPAPLRALAAAIRPGAVIKCFAAYDRAFWCDAGMSGEAYRPRGTVRAVVDASPPGGGPAILLAFVVGDAAVAWHRQDPDDRRRHVLDTLCALFGEPAREPLDYLEADWTLDPWCAGCVAGTPPGALTAGGGTTWRGSYDRIHLAGTEAAVRWPGYMEGAIEAGERAAAAILSDLEPGLHVSR